jgi:hypothetical protein
MKKLFIAALAVFVLVGIYSFTFPTGDSPAKLPSTPISRDIRLSVTGTTSTSMTYNNGTEQTQENSQPTPWIKEYTTKSILPVVLLAQNQARGGNTITCAIYVNGKMVTSNTSTGPYAVVTCTEK